MVKKLLFLMAICVSILTKVASQSAWTTYNTSNSGIPNNSINQLEIDPQGNKWLITSGNLTSFGVLSKFDGTNWITYNTSNSGIASNSVRKIVIDAQGNKWILTSDGLSKFDGINWITYNTSNSGIAGNNIGDLVIDPQGNKWIVTNGGLNKFDGINWVTYSQDFSIISFAPVRLFLDTQGNKFILKETDLLKFDGTNWTIISNRVSKLLIDLQGNGWTIGAGGSLDKIISVTNVQPIFADAGVFNIVMDFQGQLWYGRGPNFYKYNGTTWTTYNVFNNGTGSSNTNATINGVAIDAQGNKWVVGDFGLCMFDGSKWTIYNANNSGMIMGSFSIQGIVIDAQGNKWISTSDKGLIKLTGEGNSVLCSSQNEIIPTYNKLCSNSTMNLSSKLISNNYKYTWIGKDSQGSNLNILNNTQSQITVSKSGQYDLKIEDAYCYIKESINVIPLDTLLNELPICMVTNQNGYNLVVWENIDNSYVDKYRIYKQSQQTSNYDLIKEQSKNILSQWTDSLSQPYSKTDSYKISVIDKCGRETPLSIKHTTILLSTSLGINGTVNLAWNPYEGFSYPNFEIWRSEDGINFKLLSSVANNAYAYIDNNPPIKAYYQIRIQNPTSCNSSKRGLNYVISNTVDKNGKTIIVAGLTDIAGFDVLLYPNPTTDVLNIEVGDAKALYGYRYRILDVVGKEVYNQLVKNPKTEISLKSLGAAGMYLFEVVDQNNKTIQSNKIILE